MSHSTDNHLATRKTTQAQVLDSHSTNEQANSIHTWNSLDIIFNGKMKLRVGIHEGKLYFIINVKITKEGKYIEN